MSAIPSKANPFRRLALPAHGCPACGRKVSRPDEIVVIHGATYHATCAVYRPAAHRIGARSR